MSWTEEHEWLARNLANTTCACCEFGCKRTSDAYKAIRSFAEPLLAQIADHDTTTMREIARLRAVEVAARAIPALAERFSLAVASRHCNEGIHDMSDELEAAVASLAAALSEQGGGR